MFLRIFVERPILSGVIAALILLAGAASIPGLPIAQYPQIAPPSVTVTSTYIGADAATVEAAVTNPLEEQINGVQGLRYMSSDLIQRGRFDDHDHLRSVASRRCRGGRRAEPRAERVGPTARRRSRRPACRSPSRPVRSSWRSRSRRRVAP